MLPAMVLACRRSPTQTRGISAGAMAGKTPIQKCWSGPAISMSWRMAERTTTRNLGSPRRCGGNARVNGIPFNDERTTPWKEGWIEVKYGSPWDRVAVRRAYKRQCVAPAGISRFSRTVSARLATRSSDRTMSILESCAKGFWSATATGARICDASGRDKRSITVHHRDPGRSVLNLMISLCPGCHARVHRTIAILSEMPALLLQRWREQHPKGHGQTMLNFQSPLSCSGAI